MAPNASISSPLPVGIVDDQAPLRESLARRLGFFPQVTVTLMAESGEDALRRLEALPAARRPAVLLMDLSMPGMGGVEATATVQARWTEIDVLALTVFDDEEHIEDMLAAGAAGYLLKDEPVERIVEAVQTVVRGEAPLSGPVARTLVDRVRKQAQTAPDTTTSSPSANGPVLTPREHQVLTLLAEGHTDAAIAQTLSLSVHTVQSYTKTLYRKLDVHSRAEAVRRAFEEGLL